MRVGVDEAAEEDTAVSIDYFSPFGIGNDNASVYEDGSEGEEFLAIENSDVGNGGLLWEAGDTSTDWNISVEKCMAWK